jgi:hypothetical protein
MKNTLLTVVKYGHKTCTSIMPYVNGEYYYVSYNGKWMNISVS